MMSRFSNIVQIEQLLWARPIPVAVMVAAFVAVVALTIYRYRRRRGLPTWVRIVLAFSRAAVLCLIVAALCEPIVAVKRTRTAKRRLMVLVDASESMSVRDQRMRSEDVVEAATALDMLPFSETADINRAFNAIDAKQRRAIAGATRLDLAKSLVSRSARSMLESVDVRFTTFSILFSRQKGELAAFVEGVRAIDSLEDGDRVLIMEACTHHPMPDDIGRVKIPRWIRGYTGKDVAFDTNAGPFRDKDMSRYQLVVHCGGCMINRAEMTSRIEEARRRHVPITNYGIAISHVHGVLRRALSPFPYESSLLEKGGPGGKTREGMK